MEPEGTQADQAGGAPSKAAPPRQGPSNAARPKGFSARGFVSVVTTGAFLALLATGAILYLVPSGRVANWTGWTLFGLTKAQWQGLHICFALLCVLASAFHVYFNWRTLTSYFTSRVTRAPALRAEWLAAAALGAIVAAGSLAELPPFAWFPAWQERIKRSWERAAESPPVPHAELLTLGALAAREGLSFETMRANLAAQGFAVESDGVILGEMAAAHGMTPSRLYDIARGAQGQGKGRADGKGGGMGGGGMGRLTLEEYCSARALDLDAALARLAAESIQASPDRSIRAIADQAGLEVRALRAIIDGGQ